MKPPPAVDPVMRLVPLLRGRVAERLGWADLRTAQKLAIDPILDGHNTLILAPTAGGKTEAAFLPLLSALYDEKAVAISGLYVSPLKALLNNQQPRLAALADMVGRTVFCWHGDVDDTEKDGFRRDPADLLMITPESLEGWLLAGRDRMFSELRAIVVDEAHAFAGSERGDHLLSLIERCAAASRHDVQRIGLSATLGNPEALLAWLSGPSRRPQTVVDPPRGGIRRYFTLKYVGGGDPSAIAAVAAPFAAGKATMFFTDSRRQTEALRPALAACGIPVKVHHASVDRRLREQAEQGIQRDASCLLCTSTMELGVDVGDLDAVLQLDAPTSVASFLQRMGRSGRRGEPGQMVVLADDPEGFLRAIALTELARRRWVEPVMLTRRSWGPYVHQILAMVVAAGRLDAAAGFCQLSRCWAFSGIREAEFGALVDHLCGLGLLERVRHQIQLGFGAEEEFGDRGFAALCAVFDGGAPQVAVEAGGEAIGSLDRGFARRLTRGAAFNLAGNTWKAGALDLQRGKLSVAAGDAAEIGALPSWRGAPSTAMAAEVASEIRAILLGAPAPDYLDPPEREQLEELRDLAVSAGLAEATVPVEIGSSRLVLWTLAGERINAVLGTAVSLELECKASWTWSRIVLRLAPGEAAGRAAGSRVAGGRGAAAFEQMEAAWERLGAAGLSRGERSRILAAIPDRTGSRFTRYLPDELASEVKAAALVDIDGAAAFASAHRLAEGGAVLGARSEAG